MSERHDIAHDVADLRDDLEFEREELAASIEHDYSTSIVPLEHRRPMWHFLGLWTTFVAGFSYMALGFELYDGGYSLVKTLGVTVLGYLLYAAYAMVGSYLGARTGQTHALLTDRSSARSAPASSRCSSWSRRSAGSATRRGCSPRSGRASTAGGTSRRSRSCSRS